MNGAETGDTTRAAIQANGFCMASMVIWAAGFPAAEVLLASWEPLPLITLRIWLSTALLVTIWAMRDGFDAVRAAPWLRGLFIGAPGFGIGAWLVLVGQDISDAVTVAVISASMPAWAGLLEVLFDGRRLRAQFVLGIGLALLGGLVASGAGFRGGVGAAGAGLSLIAVIMYAWSSRATVKGIEGTGMLGRTTITIAGGAVAMSVITALSAAAGQPVAIGGTTPTDLAAIAFYALLASALAQFLWIVGVRGLGIAVASLHLNAAPFYVMLFMLAFQGSWSWAQAAGGLLVAAGVLVAQRRPRVPA